MSAAGKDRGLPPDMVGWMVGWMDAWMEGWIDGWMGGWIEGRMYGWAGWMEWMGGCE